MSLSLLVTKLYFPQARSDAVRRSRLVERLESGMRGSLTLIAAPAGYGKTTLLAEWRVVSDQNLPVAWLSLDAGDNDLVRFMLYLTTAFDTLQPALTENTGFLLQSPQLPPVDVIGTALLNELSVYKGHLALVLDDYHVITNKEIHDVMAFLLDHCLPNLHLVILTRANPPLPLAKLRAQGQLTEIRAADLRFTFDESTVFLNRAMGLRLSAGEITALEERTEGWIAGLQLAALSIQGREDTATFIASFTGSHRYIIDYLAEEVLNRQTEVVRDFLLKTSILERLTASLCEEVSGYKNGQAILEMLARANLFLIPLDDEWYWFRYHHLFADLLRHHLKNNNQDQLFQLHKRAAAWYDQHQLVIEAIEHAFNAQDYANVKRLLRTYFPGWLRVENRECILHWFQEFPYDFLLSDPWLCVIYGWLMWRDGENTKALTYLDDAQQALVHLETTGFLKREDLEYINRQAEVLAFQALVLASKGSTQRVFVLANQALDTVAQDEYLTRAIAYLALQIFYRHAGEIDKAIDACIAGLMAARASGEIGTTVSLFQSLGVNFLIQGRLHQAADLYTEALAYAAHKGEANYPTYGLIRMRLADLYYQWNQLDNAEGLLKLGLERADFGRNLWGMIYGRYLLCLIQLARGELREARSIFSEIEALLPEMVGAYFEKDLAPIMAFAKARLGMLRGTQVQKLVNETTLDESIETSQINPLIYRIRTRYASGNMEDITDLLSVLEIVTTQRGHLFWLIEVLILQAVNYRWLGDKVHALICLERAISLAEPEGFVRVFLDEGEFVLDMLKDVSSRIEDESLISYTRILLAASAATSSVNFLVKKPLPADLSERELEILSLISTGYSNKQIAGELFLAIGTVKRHTSNIFNKLDVRNRTEAVAKARELDLL